MSITLEVEVDEYEIIRELRHDPDLITSALRELSNGTDRNAMLYKAALNVLEASEGKQEQMEAEAWAVAFRSMDSIDQIRAVAELLRQNPSNEILVGLRP